MILTLVLKMWNSYIVIDQHDNQENYPVPKGFNSCLFCAGLGTKLVYGLQRAIFLIKRVLIRVFNKG